METENKKGFYRGDVVVLVPSEKDMLYLVGKIKEDNPDLTWGSGDALLSGVEKTYFEEDKELTCVGMAQGTLRYSSIKWAAYNDKVIIRVNEFEPNKSIDELRDYMLRHFVDEYGNLDISGLDFSSFDGNVSISDMKVKRTLLQNRQEVQGDLCQNEHKVVGRLEQSRSTVGDNYYCEGIQYGKKAFWGTPQKVLKEVSVKELERMGYKLKEEY